MKSGFKMIENFKLSAQAGLNILKLSLNPQNTDSALSVSDRFLELGLFNSGVEHLKNDPRTSEVFKSPYSMPPYDLDEMLKLPTDSLGNELAKTMKDGNFDPNYFRRKNPDVEGKVILDHIEQTHDIWHIVLGFDTSVPDEVGILAFEFGQLRAPQAAAFLAGAIVRCLFTDLRQLPPIMDAIAEGWQLSKTYPPLFAVNWSEIMHLPTESICNQLKQGKIPTAQKSEISV